MSETWIVVGIELGKFMQKKKKKDDKGCPKLRLLSHFAHIKDKM